MNLKKSENILKFKPHILRSLTTLLGAIRYSRHKFTGLEKIAVFIDQFDTPIYTGLKISNDLMIRFKHDII